jgi:DNA-binding MarR family transcriptional regulator
VAAGADGADGGWAGGNWPDGGWADGGWAGGGRRGAWMRIEDPMTRKYMHVQALDATTISALASNLNGRYGSCVGTVQSQQVPPALPGPGADPETGRGPVTAADPAIGESPVTHADQLVEAWRAVAASHAAACAALERELGRRHELGVSEFEVLERLAEGREHKFRAQELADAVHLSQSALSRLIGRLEGHGLVERCLCDMDRRGIYVILTEAGLRRHAEAAPTHRAVLASVLPAEMLIPPPVTAPTPGS